MGCMYVCMYYPACVNILLVSDKYDAAYFTGYESLTEAAFGNGEWVVCMYVCILLQSWVTMFLMHIILLLYFTWVISNLPNTTIDAFTNSLLIVPNANRPFLHQVCYWLPSYYVMCYRNLFEINMQIILFGVFTKKTYWSMTWISTN